MPISFEKKLPLILLLAFLMLAALGFFAYQSTSSLREAVKWQKHTQTVLLKLDETLIAATDVETGGRGFVISGTDNFLEPYESGRQNALKTLEELKALTPDNKQQADNLVQLTKQVNEKIAKTESYIELRRRDGLLNAVNELSKGEGGIIMNQIRQTIQKMRDEESRLLKFREESLESTLNSNFWLMVVSSLAGIGALGLANFVVLLEIKKRKVAETSLEKRVEERTNELEEANKNLRESELFSRSVIESSPDCFKVLDLEGRFVSMNNQGMCLMEIDDFEPFIGKKWIDNWEGIERKLAEDAFEKAIRGESAQFEGVCKTAKGNLKWWEVALAPIVDGNGKIHRIISVSREVTERKNNELEREQLLINEQNARRDAEIATRLRDEFMATVSHELRTPLNAILGWAKILKAGKADEKTSVKAVDTIIKNAETQNRLIEDLMDVARIVSGKLVIEREDVNVAETVTTAVETIKPTAGEKKISVDLSIEGDARDRVISGDATRLRQILSNLLTNAVKFTPEEGKIDVSLAAENNHVEIKVKDNGAGISKEFLPYVFDRFRQDAANVEKSGGLGLGLAIVRQLTKLHGGKVSVESEGENKGATFTVTFPVK